MIDLIYTKDGIPSGIAAKNDESEDIAAFITSSLLDDGVPWEEAETLAESVVRWCLNAKSGDYNNMLAQYGFEIYSYDEIESADRAEALSHGEAVDRESEQPEPKISTSSVLDKLRMLKDKRLGHAPNGRDRAATEQEVQS